MRQSMEAEAGRFQRQSFWLEDRRRDWTVLTSGKLLKKVAKETIVFTQGAPIGNVFVVVQGRVRLVTYSAEGRERHILVVGPGGLVGEAGLIDRGHHLTSAVVSAEAALYVVPKKEFIDSMHLNALILHQVLAFADQRFQAMLQHHELLGAGPALKRIGLALMGLAHVHGEPHPRGLKIQMRFTQSEMASICSISRMSVSTALGHLSERGLLLREGPWVVLPDVQALEKFTLRP